MNMTKDTLQSLWQYLETRRGKESVDAQRALLALARGEISGEVSTDVIEAIIQQVGTRESGEFVSPKMISQFMADLASMTQPKSVLDPVCGSGGMLRQVISIHKPDNAEGIEINGGNYEIAAALLKDLAAITLGDALDVMPQLRGSYDLIVADPPLGVHVQPAKLPSPLKSYGLRDLAQNITIYACKRIAPKGVVSIIMSPAALNHKSFINAVHGAGCRIRAVLHVPPGIRLNTQISSQLLVIDHGAQGEVFVGQLSDDPDHSKRLLQNFKRHKSDKHPSLGRTLPLDNFIGFEALEAEHLLLQRVRNTSLLPIPFTELVKEESRKERDSLEHTANGIPDNTVLLPQSGIRLKSDVFNIPSRDRTLTCFTLNERKVHASYFIRWIESDLGQLALQAAGANSLVGMPRITKKALERLTCHIPSIEDQNSILEALRHLERLRNEAKEIEAQCWTGHHSSDDILQHAQTINHEDRYEDWLATLPYPLASILWRHRVSGDDPRIRFGVLLHFFEALAEFLATIHLSAFMSHAAVWHESHGELLKALSAQNLNLERATFGTWKVVVEKISKTTRGMLEKTDDASVATALYAVNSTAWLNKLCAPEITQVLARANGIRNTHSGHGGAMGKSQAESLENDLRDMVEEVRSVWGRGWNQYELLLIDRMAFSNGQFTYESPRIMGANSQFERVSRIAATPMETGQLYLLSEGAPKGLKLLPLVRVMASPSQVANACYFYNRSERDGQRFLSYHFEQESEVCQYFEDTAMILQQLATPSGNQAAEVDS